MSAAGLEKTLRDLPRIGKLVKDRGYRQVWRFEHENRAYFLKFYPRTGFRDRFRRLFRGSPALAEFTKLQRLQSAEVPAPRPVAVLMGFKIDDRAGDAVIIEAIEPAIPLIEYLNDFELRGEPIPDHLQLATQIRQIVLHLAKARLGHEDLHLGNFLLHDGKLILLDAYAVRIGGMTVADLMHLGHSVSRFATRTDLLRGWYELGPKRPPPRNNPAAGQEWRDFLRKRVQRDNAYFGRISLGDWSGTFFKLYKHPRRWSTVSQLQISAEDWDRELPPLLEKVEKDALKFIKRGNSGDVLAAQITVGGREIDVIIKRPRHRYWYRYINGIWRGTRARREWFKAWKVIVRNLPTAWPLLYIEKRHTGYVTDGLIIFERVPGPMLAWAKLNEMPANQREQLFRRAGRILRRIDRLGFAHFDAKAANWIVRPDEKLGPMPVMIDIDGIRHRRWTALGLRRLLKSMQENKQYTPADSLALCLGYAPGASPQREGMDDAETDVEATSENEKGD
ncbi:MAG TPA: lipopolysaccharide kinase InaA family protein [Tepidisphaeraceae bacterium]|nr:lipopolysaccharide kinase InaA family protein [Tepidisphaeraceae bacterium]